jgi:septum formation protein
MTDEPRANGADEQVAPSRPALHIVLASKSPRRRELLEQAGVRFTVHASEVDETLSDELAGNPYEAVGVLSERKAGAVVQELLAQKPQGIWVVIGSDTMVVLNGEVFGKPRDMDDARRMLRAMSGHYHEVYSGIAVGNGKKTVVDAVSTKVYFRQITDSEIERYISESAVLDKAGAYGIQERASLFVEKIEGDYFNIVGLPVCRLGEILRDEFGYNL